MSGLLEGVRGEMISSSDARPSKTYAEGRVCAEEGCTTRLSRYNDQEKCFTHAEPGEFRLRARRRRRTE